MPFKTYSFEFLFFVHAKALPKSTKHASSWDLAQKDTSGLKFRAPADVVQFACGSISTVV